MVDSIKKTKSKLNKLRIIEQEIKSDASKLGEKTKAVIPSKLEVMFAGKMAMNMIESRVMFTNMLSGYKREYKEENDETFERIEEMVKMFDKNFDTTKRQLEKYVSNYPLVEEISKIKGVTGYQVAILMSLIKDISRFDTASKLVVYSGQGVIDGGERLAVTKANIHKIKEYYLSSGRGEFNGFNTKLGGRMYVITESMLKQQGWFYKYYARLRERIALRCRNNGEIFICTKEQAKESKGVMKEGREYMIGKKNYSLDMFTHNNARRRIGRIFLHVLWERWRTLEGLPIRAPYAVDYLGHTDYIRYEDVIVN